MQDALEKFSLDYKAKIGRWPDQKATVPDFVSKLAAEENVSASYRILRKRHCPSGIPETEATVTETFWSKHFGHISGRNISAVDSTFSNLLQSPSLVYIEDALKRVTDLENLDLRS
jgi:hypothetical protein